MSEHFSVWQERCIHDLQACEKASALLSEFAQKNKGVFRKDTRMSMLVFLFAVQRPEQYFLTVDEWNAIKYARGFFMRVQKTLLQEKAFLAAYILAREGDGEVESKEEGEKVSFRETCLLIAGCSASEGKLLREVLHIHTDLFREIAQKRETRIILFAKELANRRGINTERFLTLLPAVFFLDSMAGDRKEHSSDFATASLLVKYVEQEYEAFPQKKEEDLLSIHREEKEAKKAALITYGLGPEEWFLRLHTPYGKERGKVVRILEHFIQGVEDAEDIRYVGEEHARELRMRSARLREDKK